MKNLVCLDIECYPNYFLIAFKGVKTGKHLQVDTSTSFTVEQRKTINKMLSNYTTFGFNSNNYDLPLIHYALEKATVRELYEASKNIIENNQPFYMTYRKLSIEQRNYDHFDISEPSPAVMISLKNYGTRIGSPKLQDLPFDPHTPLKAEQIQELKDYCENDLNVTIDLYKAIEDRIALRVSMGEQYGLDLRSKSDAQIAETVIASEIKKSSGKTISKPTLKANYKPKYKAPQWLRENASPLIESLLDVIEVIPFDLASNGAVKMPKELANMKIEIGNTVYKMGIGGLHSQEKSLSIESNEDSVMRNADFTSYYPFIILNNNLAPKHIGEDFLKVYRSIVETRLKAKAEGNKLVADSLKITINGSFGKFGSKYSKLYSPDLLLATTITGQLSLLMVIEEMENHGISVVSANTDGLEYFCPRDKVNLAETIILDLELISGFDMEHGEYKALHARDVNNYVAVYDGYTKAKGIYAETTLSKGRSTPIVYEAVRKYLLDGTPLSLTLMNCIDINQFVSARTVKGGGVYDNEYLGKMVRWYYSLESKGYISYKSNGNKVPKTDRAKPMMDLTNEIPSDLDYTWYLDEAVEALKNLGVDYVI